MPRYTPDPTKASFGFIVLPKGSFRLSVEEPKSFEAKDKVTQQVKNFGVRANSKILDGDVQAFVGKNNPIVFYQHTDGACNFSKQILAAILGCKNDDEFNEKYGAEDWSFNTDDQTCGSGWHLIKGKVVDIEAGDPQPNQQTGDLQSNITKWRVVE